MVSLSNIVGAVAGGAIAFSALAFYNELFENPSIRAEERRIVQAANEALTQEAIHEVQGKADKARAMRAYCRSVGKLYDFAAVACIDGPAGVDD